MCANIFISTHSLDCMFCQSCLIHSDNILRRSNVMKELYVESLIYSCACLAQPSVPKYQLYIVHAVVELARHVMNLTDANSTEFDPDTKTPCVIFMPEVTVCEWLWILVDLTYTDCH